jgi:hypothetical protein
VRCVRKATEIATRGEDVRDARGLDHLRERERLVSLVRLSSELALPVEGSWLAFAVGC